MRKMALYCRVAKKETDNSSYQTQQQQLIDYAIQSGTEDFFFFGDNGESGTTADRPMFQKLLEEIRGGTVSEVVFSKFSRIARDFRLAESFIKLCAEKQVTIRFLDRIPPICPGQETSSTKKETQTFVKTLESLLSLE